MKKQKIIQLGIQHPNKQDLAAISALQEGLNKIDQFPVYTPDLPWFQQMVAAEKQKARKKLLQDLTIFLIIALVILSVVVVSLYQNPFVFIVLQVISTIFIAVYTAVRMAKKASTRYE